MDEVLRAIADLRSEMRAELASICARLDEVPLLNRSLTNAHQDIRSLRAAFNDFALTNVTKGEIEALHEDVNRVQAENASLQVRLETAERLIRELRNGRR